MEDNKTAMMRCLQELAFAVQESTLFLDTHPTDQQALAYHKEKLAAFNDLKKRYAGSALGASWAYIQTLVMVLIYWVVFQYGLKNGSVSGVSH